MPMHFMHGLPSVALVVFVVFFALYLGEKLTPSHLLGFGFICLCAFVMFKSPLH